MEVESSTYTDFISCDRAGRRNAVHDIQREATTISMRKLTEDMGDLAVQGAARPYQHVSTHSKHKLEICSLLSESSSGSSQAVKKAVLEHLKAGKPKRCQFF